MNRGPFKATGCAVPVFLFFTLAFVGACGTPGPPPTRADQADALLSRGIEYYANGDLGSGLSSFDRALETSASVDYRKGVAMAQNNIGVVKLRQQRYREALEHLDNSLEIYRALNNIGPMGVAELNAGLAHLELGNHRQAEYHLKRALETARRNGEEKLEAEALNNLGLLMKAVGHRDKALEYYRLSLTISKTAGYCDVTASTLFNLGTLYLREKDTVVALSHYTRALEIDKGLENSQGIGWDLLGMAQAYSLQCDYGHALNDYLRALHVFRFHSDMRRTALILYHMAATREKAGQPHLALENYRSALKIAEAEGMDTLAEKIRPHLARGPTPSPSPRTNLQEEPPGRHKRIPSCLYNAIND